MDTTIVIWFQNEAVTISQTIAQKFGLKNNYQIKSEDKFWLIIEENAEHGIAACEAKITPSAPAH